MKKVLGLLALLSGTLFARELTLESAIDLALENGKTIKTSELSKENAQLDVKRAFKSALPNVVYDAVYQKSEYGRKINDHLDRKIGYQQSIGIYQPLFTGGAVRGGIIGAKAYKNIADFNYLAEKRDVRLEIVELYSNIIKGQKNLSVLEGSMKELQARYAKQKAQLDLRLITKADLLKTEYNILDLESQITAEKNDITINKTDLKLKLMIPSGENLTLKEFNVPEHLLTGIDLESDLNQALIDSLSAKIAQNKVKYAEAEKMVSRGEMLPQVEAFAKYGAGERVDLRESSDEASWAAGVSVNWNVFDFGKSYDSYKSAKNKEEIEGLNKSLTEDSIQLTVTKNYKEAVRLEQLKNSRRKSLDAALENFTIDTERYNAGLISTVDYLNSEAQYREAAVDYNTATIEYYVAFEKYRSSLI